MIFTLTTNVLGTLQSKDYTITPLGWNNDHTEFMVKVNNDKAIIITDNGNEGWLSSDTRFIRLKNVYYEYIGFDVKDGLAISNGIENTKRIINDRPYSEKDDNFFVNDVVAVVFPKVEEIFNDYRKMVYAFSYYEEWSDLEDLLENGGRVTLTWLFEGFFFNDEEFSRYYVKRGLQPFKSVSPTNLAYEGDMKVILK